jgi:hypothetical protein
MSTLEMLKKITTDDTITSFDANCIRQKSNWSKVKKQHKIDNGYFDSDVFLNDIKNSSPKVDALLKKIADLDRKDEKKYGKKFKHFIFSDLKSSGHGAKMLAAALISSGWTLGYNAKMKIEPLANAEDESENYDSGDFSPIDLVSFGKLKMGGEKKKTDDDEDDETNKVKWGPITMLEDEDLKKTRGYNFYLLSSVSVFDKPISVKMKKDMLAKFNSRPDNIYGDLARIIIMDSGFKEGIDLFDIKYIHIFEPSVNAADQKQVIGRGTRTCGQKGLEFNPTKGWPLHVFIYDLEIPGSLQSSLLHASSAFELFMKAMNVDIRLVNFMYDIERLSVIGSVDYELNEAVHNFSVNLEDDDEDEQTIFGGKHLKFGEIKNNVINNNKIMNYQNMRTYIIDNYGQYKWKNVEMENLCLENQKGGAAASILNYTPSQDFIRHYFKPSAPVKGMLLHHSVGTGKTASAIAAASTNFEPEGYTILWVTRTTLKNDIWKNMFVQVANETIRNKIANGEEIPDDPKKQMRLLSKSWRIRPLSYKQFSNLVSKQNEFYTRLVKENGEADPLRKTLLIIDEAHKLYGGGDLSSIERPDMVALHESLMKSYAISGADSVRLLLMTATPITESPMELIKLINLCKPIDAQMPHTFESFSTEYLDEEGHFTSKGEQQYLDTIAGHISYLNREKDARQFAQPIIKRVMVPIVDKDEMERVKQYDKFIAKTEIDEHVIKTKETAEKISERLEGELSEMGKERFQYLKKACEKNAKQIPAKTCNKIMNKHITELTNEVKEYVKSIKTQLDVIKKEIKQISHEKTKGLEKIKQNIERRPQDFEQYKNSSYYSLRSNCGKTARTNQELLEHLKQHPDIIKYNTEIKEHKDHIEMLKNKLKIDTEAYKLRLKQLKQSLKDRNLTPLEREIIRVTINNHAVQFRKTQKISSIQIKKDIYENMKTIASLTSDKKQVYNNTRKTMKQEVKEQQKKIKAAKKEEKKLRKTIRKTGDIEYKIEDEEINKIVKKYEMSINSDLEEAKKNEEMEEKRKADIALAKQAKKEAAEQAKKEKEIKKTENEKAKTEKRKAKEEANKAKLAAKNARKTKKKSPKK